MGVGWDGLGWDGNVQGNSGSRMVLREFFIGGTELAFYRYLGR